MDEMIQAFECKISDNWDANTAQANTTLKACPANGMKMESLCFSLWNVVQKTLTSAITKPYKNTRQEIKMVSDFSANIIKDSGIKP